MFLFEQIRYCAGPVDAARDPLVERASDDDLTADFRKNRQMNFLLTSGERATNERKTSKKRKIPIENLIVGKTEKTFGEN